MARFLVNASKVLGNPRMLAAYARWHASRITSHGGALAVFGGRLCGFESFSEYWGVQENLPTPGEQALVHRMMIPGSLGLDVGGNLGQFALLMSSAPGVFVHTFEPVSKTFQRLQANLMANDRRNVTAWPLAICDQTGTIHMEMTSSAATNRINLTEGVAVPCSTLDAFCAKNQIDRVALLKIDVEGAEPMVLKGAHSLLANRAIQTVLVEMCPANLQRFGFTPADVERELAKHGYGLFRLRDDGGSGERLTGDALERMELENILAVPV
ncbi:FkbM family methyltransferase [Methylococcus capsulatus]|uniref:FkbM family methyltransferase n=1 Tax=Methylococcus capsulatus TaxID=414 RepID=UPI002FDB4F6D